MSIVPNPSLPDETPALQACEPTRGIRAMEDADLKAVGRLFNKAFRSRDEEPRQELLDYLDNVFMKNPCYTPEHGSMVHQDKSGRVDSALLALPMPFHACGRRITARVMCAFMADGKTGFAGAARLAREIRLRPDLCFTDNASPVSADHTTIAGGITLPILSLEWRRTFRPLQASFERLRGKLPALRSVPLAPVLAPIDALLRKAFRTFIPEKPVGTVSTDAGLDAFFACTAPMTERFAIRPDWSREDLAWLMETAAQNTSLGELRCRTIANARGETIGAYLFFGRRGEKANVLNILCFEGRELDVVSCMFADLADDGYAAVEGKAQPFLMNALMRQRQMIFRHRGYFCMVTQHADVREAAIRGDIFVGGLASESWSRLLTDFR